MPSSPKDFARENSTPSATAQEIAQRESSERALVTITEHLAGFCADELRVVLAITSRLAIGRARYGALDLAKPRDWAREAAEEAADFVIYRAAAELAK